MSLESNILMGHVASNLPSALLALRDVGDGHWSCLVTSIDSETRPDRLRAICHQVGLTASFDVGFPVIPYRLLANPSIVEGLFTGFDEVWLARSTDGPVEQFPTVTAVSPIDFSDLNEGQKVALQSSMRMLGSSIVLGDGIGLNFATSEVEIANLLSRL